MVVGYGDSMKWVVWFLCVLYVIPQGGCYFSSLFNSALDKINYEICNDYFTTPDFMKLRRDLKELLFGQDIITDKIIPLLESHYSREPKKALVICMHGWTGCGKNYATKIIIDSLFKKQSNSQFVRMFNGRLHFPIDQKKNVDKYKMDLQNWVRGNVTNCPRSVFVFDEVDKMPGGVIDAIKPFFDYYEKIDTTDYRKSIFIFISNIGSQTINSRYMELWRSGKSRTDMKYKDFEPYLRNSLYNTNGGFKNSAILEGHLVSLYLPFLPLSMDQIVKCINTEFKRQGIYDVPKIYQDAVLDEMEFNPDGFSTSGCKRIADLVASVKYKRQYEEL